MPTPNAESGSTEKPKKTNWLITLWLPVTVQVLGALLWNLIIASTQNLKIGNYILLILFVGTTGYGAYRVLDVGSRLRSFWSRIGSPEMARFPYPIRPPILAWRAMRRGIDRSLRNPFLLSWLVAWLGAFVLVIGYASATILWPVLYSPYASFGLLQFGIFAFLLIGFSSGLLVTVVVGLTKRLLEERSDAQLSSRVMGVVQRYVTRALPDHFKDPPTHSALVHHVVCEHSGTIKIQATNARFVVNCKSESEPSLLRQAIDGGQHIRLLIADPMGDLIRKRANRIHGRYVEGYLIPLLRLLKIMDSQPKNQLEVKTQSKIPNSRLFFSDRWMIVDPYDDYRGAIAQGIVFPRLYSVDHIGKLITDIEVVVNGNNAAKISSVLRQHIDFNAGMLLEKNANPPETLYVRESRNYELDWNQAEALQPLQSWEDAKLKELGRLIGIPKKKLHNIGRLGILENIDTRFKAIDPKVEGYGR